MNINSLFLYYSFFSYLNQLILFLCKTPVFNFILTTASGLGLITFSNSAAAAAGRKKGNQVLPIIAAAGMLLINGVLTVGSGVGAELLMNQSNLVEKQANKKADEYIRRLSNEINDENSPDFLKFQELKEECDEGIDKLGTFEKNSPEAERLHTKLFGSVKNRKEWAAGKDLSTIDRDSALSLPICHKADVYEHYVNVDAALQDKQEKLTKVEEKRILLGNDTQFLKQNALAIYDNHFNENGGFKNGSVAVEIALSNLLENFKEGEYSQLGFALFLFLISFVTSLIACFWTISYSYLSESKDSHSDVARAAIDKFFTDQENKLSEKHQQEEHEQKDQNYEKQLLTLYRSKILEQGVHRRDFNPLFNSAKRALLLEKEFKNSSRHIDFLENILNKNQNLNVEEIKKETKDILEIKKEIENILEK